MREIDERTNGAQGIIEPVIERDVEGWIPGVRKLVISNVFISKRLLFDWTVLSISLEDTSTGQWHPTREGCHRLGAKWTIRDRLKLRSLKSIDPLRVKFVQRITACKKFRHCCKDTTSRLLAVSCSAVPLISTPPGLLKL